MALGENRLRWKRSRRFVRRIQDEGRLRSRRSQNGLAWIDVADDVQSSQKKAVTGFNPVTAFLLWTVSSPTQPEARTSERAIVHGPKVCMRFAKTHPRTSERAES